MSTTASLARATHLRWLVDDLEPMRVFYRDVLGFREVVAAPVYIEFDTGGMRLGLYKRDLMEAVVGRDLATTNRDCVLGLAVGDVDTLYRELVAHGVPSIKAPHDQPAWFLRVAHVADPQGHILELHAPLKTVLKAEAAHA
jgi:glyoxylase I family protein